MNIRDYNFKIGDKVITVEGQIGEIVNICDCEECRRRGFCEPMWKRPDDYYVNYITIYQAESGFPGFYQIGRYHFNDFDKDEVLRQITCYEEKLIKLKKQLSFIEELEEYDKR